MHTHTVSENYWKHKYQCLPAIIDVPQRVTLRHNVLSPPAEKKSRGYLAERKWVVLIWPKN